jgi:hypothetical protein
VQVTCAGALLCNKLFLFSWKSDLTIKFFATVCLSLLNKNEHMWFVLVEQILCEWFLFSKNIIRMLWFGTNFFGQGDDIDHHPELWCKSVYLVWNGRLFLSNNRI